MNFRSVVSSGARRPIEAMIWISEIESAKSFAELKTSNTINGHNCRQTLRFLTRKKRVASRKSSMEIPREEC